MNRGPWASSHELKIPGDISRWYSSCDQTTDVFSLILLSLQTGSAHLQLLLGSGVTVEAVLGWSRCSDPRCSSKAKVWDGALTDQGVFPTLTDLKCHSVFMAVLYAYCFAEPGTFKAMELMLLDLRDGPSFYCTLSCFSVTLSQHIVVSRCLKLNCCY